MASDDEIAWLLARLGLFLTVDANEVEGEVVVELFTALECLVGQHGLGEASLNKGYDLALGGQLPTSQSLRLLPLLLPRAPLPLGPVLLTVSVLGEASHSLPPRAGKVDYAVQRRALEQLVVLLELGGVSQEGRDALDRLYGVIERGLLYRTLREPTAALLRLVMRRHHVQPDRVDEARSLLERDPAPPASLVRLLEGYRSHEPDRVYQSRKRARGRPEHSQELEAWSMTASTVLNEGANDGETGEGREHKRHRSMHGLRYPSPSTRPDRPVTPLSEVASLAELGDKVETVALPSQAASVLSAASRSTHRSRLPDEDRVRSWVFLLRSGYENDSEHLARLSHWIVSQLGHELYDVEPTEEGEARIEDLLCRMRAICELGGELIEALEPFLAELLLEWDGDMHRKAVFDLVALLKPFGWQDLESHFLGRLRTLATTASADWIAGLVGCLSALIGNLAVRDNWDLETPVSTAFGGLDDGAPYLAALEGILAFTDEVILSATLRFPTSLVLRTAALSFYESALALPLELDLPVIVLPSPAFTYICLLAGEVMSVSRICGIVARLREALTGRDSAIVKGQEGSKPELVASLNGRLITLVGALWQRKFLADDAVMGLPAETIALLNKAGEGRSQQVANSQSVTTHGALAVLARDCLSVLAAQDGKSADGLVGPVTLASLKQLSKDPAALHISFNEFRPRLIEYLEDKGATGLSAFLFSSLSSLVERRKSGAGPGAAQ